MGVFPGYKMVQTGVVQIVGVEADVVQGQTCQTDVVWVKLSRPNPVRWGTGSELDSQV